MLVSKRSAFFLYSAAGSVIIGMLVGRLQFKVIKAAMLDDFLLMPAFSRGDVILILRRDFTSHVSCPRGVNIQFR